MAYIASDSVKRVFPTSLRTYDGSVGKFTSEENLTNIIKSAVDSDSYIKSINSDTASGITTYELVIGGYYFKFLRETITIQANEYAHIFIDNNGRLVNPQGNTNLDSKVGDTYQFLGLLIDTESHHEPSTTEPIYAYSSIDLSLALLESYKKYDATKLYNLDSINVGSASKLDPGSKINGEPFDGSADITTKKWGEKRKITLKSGEYTKDTENVDGSTNITLELPDNLHLTEITATKVHADLDGNASSATNATNVALSALVDLTTGNTIISAGTGSATVSSVSSAWQADKWTTSQNFRILSGKNYGTPLSVNGSTAIDLPIPSILTASLVGNASSADTADKLDSNCGDANRLVYFGSKTENGVTTKGNPMEGMKVWVLSAKPTSGVKNGDIWIRF